MNLKNRHRIADMATLNSNNTTKRWGRERMRISIHPEKTDHDVHVHLHTKDIDKDTGGVGIRIGLDGNQLIVRKSSDPQVGAKYNDLIKEVKEWYKETPDSGYAKGEKTNQELAYNIWYAENAWYEKNHPKEQNPIPQL